MKKNIEGMILKLDQNAIGTFSAAAQQPHFPEVDESNIAQALNIQKGNILVTGKNLGTQGVAVSEALKSAGVSCIIAESFSRSFYRNCINIGLPLIENSEAFGKLSAGESISIDFEKGEILCKKGAIGFSPYSEIIYKILLSGGLVPHAKRMLGK